MRRFFLLIAVVLVSTALLSGCTQNQTNDHYQVMFRGLPGIYDDAVYAGGVNIGRIVSTESGAGNAVKVAIAIDAAFKPLIAENSVFYVAAGRLNHATLDAWGAPLDASTPILGFPSKLSFQMFKLKTLLTRSADAAAREAEGLSRQM